jgi:hypothetical protein
MPALVLIIPVIAFDLWIFLATFRILSRNELGDIWRKRVPLLLIIGAACAVWFAFFRKFEVSGQTRVDGFPIPAHVSLLENNQWRVIPLPSWFPAVARAVDFITGFAVALLPVKLAAFMKVVKATLDKKQ